MSSCPKYNTSFKLVFWRLEFVNKNEIACPHVRKTLLYWWFVVVITKKYFYCPYVRNTLIYWRLELVLTKMIHGQVDMEIYIFSIWFRKINPMFSCPKFTTNDFNIIKISCPHVPSLNSSCPENFIELIYLSRDWRTRDLLFVEITPLFNIFLLSVQDYRVQDKRTWIMNTFQSISDVRILFLY